MSNLLIDGKDFHLGEGLTEEGYLPLFYKGNDLSEDILGIRPLEDGGFIDHLNAYPAFGLKGTSLIRLADEIARVKGYSFLKLNDASEIGDFGCKAAFGISTAIFLRHIYAAHRGTSWYGAHGYHIEGKTKEEEEIYLKKVLDMSLGQASKILRSKRSTSSVGRALEEGGFDLKKSFRMFLKTMVVLGRPRTLNKNECEQMAIVGKTFYSLDKSFKTLVKPF